MYKALIFLILFLVPIFDHDAYSTSGYLSDNNQMLDGA